MLMITGTYCSVQNEQYLNNDVINSDNNGDVNVGDNNVDSSVHNNFDDHIDHSIDNEKGNILLF